MRSAPESARSGATSLTRPVIAVMGVLLMLNSVSIDIYISALPRVAADLRSTPSGAQLSLSAFLAGLIAGQLLVGPISDAVGRRRPLLVGTVAYVAGSVLCACAPVLAVLVSGRVIQGLAASTAIVTVRAAVRDRASGRRAARVTAMLFTVMGVAPVIGPLLGAVLVPVTGWRGLFVGMAAVGCLLTAAAWFLLPETHPGGTSALSGGTAATPRRGGVGSTLRGYARLLRDRRFLCCALLVACTSGAIFAYISGSAFFLEERFGLSPQSYGLLNGVNSAGTIAGSALAARMMRVTAPPRLIAAGVLVACVAAALLAGDALLRPSLFVTLPAGFALVSSFGLVVPATSALALDLYAHGAASAAAVLGALQYSTGALVVPLVGLGGQPHALLATAIVVAALWMVGVTAHVVLRRQPIIVLDHAAAP